MKILVTFAVASEFAAWRRQHDFRQVAHEPFALYVSEIAGNAVRALVTGMGTAAATDATRWALASPADICISSGFAGALNPELQVGTVLAGRVVLRAERELAVASDHQLVAVAEDAGARQVNRFLTSEHLIADAAQKIALAGEADAVEMESFVILAEAARHGVRAAAIRSVSDAASYSLPYDFDQARDARGQISLSALASQIIRQPQCLPALLRFARDCRFAGRQLADFLDHYLQLLSARLDLSQSEMVAAT
jgi:adenosylhomocysteine nucleosidase